MMNEPKRRRVTDLAEKLNFLATHSQVVRRHRLSMADLSEECGWSRSWLKSAKDPSRNTRSIATEPERKLAKLCQFDLNWWEWREGFAEAFKQRYLAEKASPTDHAQPEASAPITPDNPDNFSQFREQEGAGGHPNVTIQNISHCNITVGLPPEAWALFREASEQTLPNREVGEPPAESSALRTALRARDPDDSDLSALRDQALPTADAGDIEHAKALLRRRIDAERKRAVANAEAEFLNAAGVKAVLGRMVLSALAYKQAGAPFRDASDMLPGNEAKKRREHHEDEACARLRQSDQKGDNTALQEAIDLSRRLLQGMPLDRAGMQAGQLLFRKFSLASALSS